jgi:hypothetical protein
MSGDWLPRATDLRPTRKKLKTDVADDIVRLLAVEWYCELLQFARGNTAAGRGAAGLELTWEEFVPL